LTAPETFTVTGGSGIYAGASGSGTVTTASFGPPSFTGNDTWSGTLVVPGHEFDLTAPHIDGAISRVVRAPRRATGVRVSFAVTAADDRDGAVPVVCLPRSGSRFRIGRTTVTCTATDQSANAAKASFSINVRSRP
jgi:hypothetical protein